MNELDIVIYSSGTTPINDPRQELKLARGLQFDNQYPGGLYGACSFFIPRNHIDPWQVATGQRLAIFNGMTQVYEGYIIATNPVREAGDSSVGITCVGAWDYIGLRQYLNRRYVDNRLEDSVWVWDTSGTAAEKSDINRETRIRITPKAEAWTTGQYAECYYTCPTGETVKKLTYTWTAAGANFKTIWSDPTNGESIIVSGAGGPTAATYTPATDPSVIAFAYMATANLTPTSDGAYYGQVALLTVYATTHNTGDFADTMTKIAKDIVVEFAAVINQDVTRIATPTNELLLPGFITQDYEAIADILTRASDGGDDDHNRYAFYFLGSEEAVAPNGKPILALQAQPADTTHDYYINYGDANLLGIGLEWSINETYNYIIVRYTDENGRSKYTTPDDDASLKDSASIAAYGQLETVYDVGESTAARALSAGQSYLAANRNIKWLMTSPAQVCGFIYDGNRNKVPACQIRSGKHLKVTNFIGDKYDALLNFLISSVSYSDEGQTASISSGTLSPVYLAPFSFPDLPPVDEKDKTKKKGRKKPPKPGPGWVWNKKKWRWVKKY